MRKIVLTLLLVIGLSFSGLAVSEQINPERVTAENPNIEFGEYHERSLSDVFSGFQLSLTGADNAAPGETINFDASVEIIETHDSEGTAKVVEFYRCADSSCDNPSEDEFIEAKSETIQGSFTVYEGNTWNWDVDYTVPEEEGHYAGVAYVYDTDTDEVLSETSEHVFEVENPTSEPEPEPDVELTSTPSFDVDDETNSVSGSLEISNNGDGDMSDSDIVEMQVRPEGSNPLSFTSSQSVCDSSYPNNVNKEYNLDAGDSERISLSADTNMGDGESYTVYFMTREDCGGEKTEPIYNSYNAGAFTFDEETVSDPEPSDQDVVEVSKPDLSFDSETNTISTRVSFKNEGGDMESSDIVEMQVRPEGSNPLAFSSSQDVCDEDRPENVHKEYSLESGETDSTTLSTNAVSEPGTYTVYLMTREDCGGDKVDPYYNSVQAGTVTIEEDSDGSVKPDSGIGLAQVLLVAAGIGLIGVVIANRRL